MVSEVFSAYPRPGSSQWLAGILAGLAAGALWGMVFVTPKAVAGFSSVDLTAGRYVACGLFAVGVMLFRSIRADASAACTWPSGRQAAVALGLSVLGYTGYYLLLAMAIGDAGSVLPTLIIGTIPLWMMMLGKPASLLWRRLLPGFLLTSLGLGVMLWVDQTSVAAAAHEVARSFGDGKSLWRGLGLATLAMASWTAFGLLNARVIKHDGNVRSTDWANWMGVAAGFGGLAMWAVLGSSWADLIQREDFVAFVWVCGITGIGAAWVASVLWNVACQRLSPSLAGQLIVSETVFGVAYSFAWDGQWPALSQWLAGALFVAGILASVRAHR